MSLSSRREKADLAPPRPREEDWPCPSAQRILEIQGQDHL